LKEIVSKEPFLAHPQPFLMNYNEVIFGEVLALQLFQLPQAAKVLVGKEIYLQLIGFAILAFFL